MGETINDRRENKFPDVLLTYCSLRSITLLAQNEGEMIMEVTVAVTVTFSRGSLITTTI
jgi:hypothetical protein